MLGASCVTTYSEYRKDEPVNAGGMCSCCGAGGHIDGPDDYWLVMKAGFTDSDGIFMSMLCAGPGGVGCFEEIRADRKKRKSTFRDEMAGMIADLLDDDLDWAQAMFEDADHFRMLDIPGEA